MNIRYNNYHKHDHRGNPWTMDSVAKEEDYCKRAVELGHTSVFTTNHGVCGSIFHWMEQAQRYNLKLCYGIEAYYAPSRFMKERAQKHIVIIARNNSGVEQINYIMSEAHTTGFYYKPRIDEELLMGLSANDVIITTACVAGIWNEPELIMKLSKKFGKNFFLELQDHKDSFQVEVNKAMLQLHHNTGIGIIHANDTHYIYPKDSELRDVLLRAKGIAYEEESSMCLDYPDSETIFKRYKAQGLLKESEVQEALENTLVFDDCEEITIINDEIKLPSVSENPAGELKQIINARWKQESKTIDPSKRKEYLKAIKTEMDIITKTHMENYFLIDYKVVKLAKEKYGGTLTNTGRGSAPSFYNTKMLGLTDIDRVSSPITLFPTRFMSVERILGARSLPDKQIYERQTMVAIYAH